MQANEIKKLCKENPDAIVDLIHQLIEANIQLTNRIKALEERLNKDSNNSNKPPSSDNLRKKLNRKSKKRKRKKGGQKGHKGHTLKTVSNPDHIKIHKVNCCKNCNYSLKKVKVKDYDKRQEFDIPPLVVEVTEHRAEKKICPCCGKEVKAYFPENITHKTQYGKRIKSLAIYLNQYQLIPYERTVEFFMDILHQPISKGTIYNFIKSAYNSLNDFDNIVKEYLTNSKIVNFDETGIMCNKNLLWLHTASTPNLTYYGLHEKRGSKAMDEIGILPDFKGTAMHDFWSSYLKYDCWHIFCNSHILRELNGIFENDKQKWALELKNLLLKIKHKVDKAKEIEKVELSSYLIKKYEKLFDKIIKKGFRKNPREPDNKHKRGRKRQTKARNLLQRLKDYKDGVLIFMFNFDMPFNNNLAERDLRMIKVQQKISNCFRSIEGGNFFSRIRSYISTVKKNHYSVIKAIENMFDQNPYIPDFIAE